MENEEMCNEILKAMKGKEKILNAFRIDGVSDYLVEYEYSDDDQEYWSAKLDFKNDQEEFITGVFLGHRIDEVYGYEAIDLLEELSQKGMVTKYKKWRKIYDITKKHGDFAWYSGISFKLIKGGIKVVVLGKLDDCVLDTTLGKSRCLFDDNLVLKYDNLEQLKTMLELVGKSDE